MNKHDSPVNEPKGTVVKYAKTIAISTLLVGSAGCASTPRAVVQEPVGPCHRVAVEGTKEGSLQVYSARRRVPTDTNLEQFFWNYDFGRNDFLYGSAHSDYTIFAGDATVFRHVRNSRNLNDDQPALVRLPAGSYTLQAEAEECGGITRMVVVPLVVEAGQMTSIHLEPKWFPSDESLDTSALVRLADGRVVGCRAQVLAGNSSQPGVAGKTAEDLAGVP